MSRSSTRKQSYTTNSDSDNDSKQTNKGFSRPKSAVTTNTKGKKNSNDDSLSDKSYEFKSNNNNNKKNSLTDTKSSFFERITGSDKYSSDSDTESVTKTPTNIDNKSKSNKSSSNNNKNEFLKPHKKQTKYSSESSSVDSSTDVSLASDRPAPKNSQTLRSRSNSTSSVQRKNKNSDTDKDSSGKSKNDRKKRNSSSSSSSSSSSYSNSSSVKKNNKKQLKSEDDSEDEEYHKGHVTKVKVNVEKKPPIDMSKWTKSGNRPSSSLEKPSDSMSDSSDTRRSISINDIPSKSHQNHKQNRSNNRKLNQTFDLELENESSSNEMTDVSPLPTPKDRKASNKKETKRNSMDMSSFYKILNEDINKRMDSVFSIFNDKFAKNSSKSNLKTSFDLNNSNSNNNNNNNSSTKYSTKINKIDAENERLYAKLMSTSQKTSSLSRNDSSFNNKPIRLTSSALNRQREQQRIEKENQQILKRLLKVKATKYLVKEEQIKDYDKKFGGLTSLNQSRANSSHSMPLGFVNSTTSMGALSHNTSVLSTKRSAKSTANNSRLSSAKSINKSNHHISIDANELLKRAASAGRHRPEWIERW